MEEIQVGGEGPEDASLIGIGEALGIEEKIRGRPWVGRAGKLFDTCLERAQVKREQVYLTNFVKRHPSNDNIYPYYQDGIGKNSYEELTERGCLTQAAPKGWDKKGYNYYALTPRGMEWREYLLEELSALPGKVILTLGAASTFALTGKGGIVKMRGAPLTCPELPDKLILPTIHPSASLKGNYLYRYQTTQDIKKAWRIAKAYANGGFSLPQRAIAVNLSFIEALHRIEELHQYSLVALDIETVAGKIAAISFANTPLRGFALSLMGGGYTTAELTQLRRAIGKVTSDPSIGILGQNVIFDITMMEWQWGITFSGPIEDTMVLQRVFQPEMPSGLGYLSSIYTDEPYYKEDGKVARDIYDLTLFLTYNGKDSCVTFEAWEKMAFIRKNPDLLKTYRFTMDLYKPLRRMMHSGLRVADDALAKARIDLIENLKPLQEKLDDIAYHRVFSAYEEEVQHEVTELEAEYEIVMEKQPKISAKTGKALKGEAFIHPIEDRRRGQKTLTQAKKLLANYQPKIEERTGIPMLLNASSPPQLCWYFYEELGITPYRNQDGNPTIDDKVLQKLAKPIQKRPAQEEASIIQQIRNRRKMLGTYIDIKMDEDGRYRTAYKPKGTVTGRLASEITYWGTGGNHQNTPEEFQSYILADKGTFFFEVDKKGAEWVVAAFASGDKEMMRICLAKEDPHTQTAHLMTGLPHEVIKAEAKLVGHVTDAQMVQMYRDQLCMNNKELEKVFADARLLPRTMSLRQMGKKSNHGLNWDEGEYDFSLINEISISEAKEIIRLYHQAYPGIRAWHGRMNFQMQQAPREVKNCFGRPWKFKGFPDRELFKRGYAFIGQSTIVDAVNQGLIYLDDHLPRIDPKVQRHDSLLNQYRFKDKGFFNADLIKLCKAMTPVMEYEGRKFTVENELQIGLSWGGQKEVELNPIAIRKAIDQLEKEVA